MGSKDIVAGILSEVVIRILMPKYACMCRISIKINLYRVFHPFADWVGWVY